MATDIALAEKRMQPLSHSCAIDGKRGLLIATHNREKFLALSAAVGEWGINVRSPEEYNVSAPPETEDTFAGNATLKARYAASISGEVALADDGGFSIAALGGRPGVASLDWAEGGSGFEAAIRRVGRELDLAGIFGGPAWMTTALAIAWPNGLTLVAEATTEGYLTWPPRGEGFDYDPIFAPQPGGSTFAEIEAKDISLGLGVPRRAYAHRIQALNIILGRVFVT